MEAAPKSITIEGFGAPDLHHSAVVQFVGLVFRKAFEHGATQIIFTHETNPAAGPPEPGTSTTTPPVPSDPYRDQDRLAALSRSLADLDPLSSAVPPTPRFIFAIKCVTSAGHRQLEPAPDYLYHPAVNCLCAMSDVRYWARGPVEGFLDLKTDALGPSPWTLHSAYLREQITLSRATAEEIAAFDRRPPIAIPPLPEPLPDVPLPEFIFRPVSPPTRLHAVVWFASRTVFYAFAYIAVFLVVMFNVSLGDALTVWLGKLLAIAARMLGLSDVFILKLDGTGNTVWVRRAGGEAFSEAKAVATDGAGNIGVAGNYEPFNADFGTTVFDDILAIADVFVTKLDRNGNFLWATSAGGVSTEDNVQSVALDTAGNAYLTGSFGVAIDNKTNVPVRFGAQTLIGSGKDADIFVAKLDSAGVFQWARQIGGTNDEYLDASTTDSAGNTLLAVFTLGDDVRANGTLLTNLYPLLQFNSAGNLVAEQALAESASVTALAPKTAGQWVMAGGAVQRSHVWNEPTGGARWQRCAGGPDRVAGHESDGVCGRRDWR